MIHRNSSQIRSVQFIISSSAEEEEIRAEGGRKILVILTYDFRFTSFYILLFVSPLFIFSDKLDFFNRLRVGRKFCV